MRSPLQTAAAFAAFFLAVSSGTQAQTTIPLKSDAHGRTLHEDAEGVRSISFSANGRSTDGKAASATLPGAPDETATWRAIGPYGGSVTAIAVSPTVPDLILAGTNGPFEYGGLFRSTDSGATWSHAPELGDKGISSIVFTPDGTAFAGTEFEGLWRSTDGGLEWSFVDLVSPNWITALAVHPSNGSQIWAGVRSQLIALMRSDDGGETWQDVGISTDATNGCVSVAFDASDPDKVYAACGRPGLIWVSADGGASWTERTDGLPDMRLYDLAHDGTRVLVGGGLGLFASSDDGLSWIALHEVTWPRPTTHAITVDPSNPRVLYAGSDGSSGAHRSTDGGISWQIAIPGTEKLTVNAIEFDPGDPSRLLLGASALGVFQSLNSGSSFQRTSYGMTSMKVNSVAVNPQNPAHLAAAVEGLNEGGVFLSSDRGANWTWDDPLPPGRYSYVAFSPQGVLHAIQAGPAIGVDEGIYRQSSDGSWESLGPDQGGAFETDLTVLRFSELDPDLIVAGGNDFFTVGAEATIWLSQNAGASWSKVHEGTVEREVVREIEILDNGSTDDMVAVFDIFLGDLAGGVLHSTDGGSSWFASDTGLPADFKGRTLCTVTGEPQSLFVAHRDAFLPPQTGALFESIDGGASWAPAGSTGTFMDLVCDPDDADRLYGAFAEDDLVRRSVDRGQSFSSFDAGLEMAGDGSLSSDSDGVRLVHNLDSRPQLYLSSSTGVWVTELESAIFADGFESGDLSAWTNNQP